MLDSQQFRTGPKNFQTTSHQKQQQQQQQQQQPQAQTQAQAHKYQKIKLLGSGSFGKAFLVRQIQTEQLFVIKQIDISDLDQNQQENARKQAKILEILDHPNIVKFRETFTTHSKKLHIVMEYADGGDLASVIKRYKKQGKFIEQAEILNYFTQICLAIKHIHDRKIIHRDLKGENVFLSEGGCVKIGDFGVARVLEHTVAKAKTVVGSPYYLSPQIIQNRPYSVKTDIWSLGALLFQMCALQPPFTANNLQYLALKIVKGSYPQLPAQYSQDLKQLIKSMLNTNANSRPTINQILSCPLLNRRIKSLLTQSQNMKEFSHTVIHKYNAFTNQIEDKLRPPPNLMEIQQDNQNYGQIQKEMKFMEMERERERQREREKEKQIKAKITPGIGKNAPPLKKKVLTSQKKVRPNTAQNLGQIMKIKSTPLQQHLLPPKLPKFPTPNMPKKRPQSPKVNIINPNNLNNLNIGPTIFNNNSNPNINLNIQSQKLVPIRTEADNKPKNTPVCFNKKKSIDCAVYNTKQIRNQSNKEKEKEKEKEKQKEKNKQGEKFTQRTKQKHKSEEIQKKQQEFDKNVNNNNNSHLMVENISANFIKHRNSQPINQLNIQIQSKDNGNQPSTKIIKKKQVKIVTKVATKAKSLNNQRIGIKPKQKQKQKQKQKKQQQNLQLLSQQQKAKQKSQPPKQKQKQKQRQKPKQKQVIKKSQLKRPKTNKQSLNPTPSSNSNKNSNNMTNNPSLQIDSRRNQQCQTQTQFPHSEILARTDQELELEVGVGENGEIFQEEKCQYQYGENYEGNGDQYQEEFQHYCDDDGKQGQQEGGNDEKQEEQQNEDLSFQLSNSSFNQTKNRKMRRKQSIDSSHKKNIQNYQKMIAQLQVINKMIDQGNGKIDNLPILGQQIPQLLQLSDKIRQDDFNLQQQPQSQNPTNPNPIPNSSLPPSDPISKSFNLINLAALSDLSQLQNLRMTLEEIFGLDNLLVIYKYMGEIIEKDKLDFNEEMCIRVLVGMGVGEIVIRRYFRLIVTVIVMENVVTNHH